MPNSEIPTELTLAECAQATLEWLTAEFAKDEASVDQSKPQDQQEDHTYSDIDEYTDSPRQHKAHVHTWEIAQYMDFLGQDEGPVTVDTDDLLKNLFS
jgi:hypothetical protein